MKQAIGILLCAFLAFTCTEARRRRSVGSLTFRAVPKLVVINATEVLKLECRAPPSVVGFPLIFNVEKTDENGSVSSLGSLHTGGSAMLQNGRKTVEGNLDQEKGPISLTLSIEGPNAEDQGNYTCRFISVSMNPFGVQTLEGKAEVTVVDKLPPNYVEPTEMTCDCENIWDEINFLKANTNTGSKPASVVAAPAADATCQSSFSARFASRHGYEIYDDITAVFDEVISNKGEAYNKETGIFTAACDGQYYFSLNLRSETDLDSGYVDGVIMVDDKAVARSSVFIDAPIHNIGTGTTSVVVSLKTGQEVKVVVKTTSTGSFTGDEYSIFSGFYLFP